MGHPHNHTHNHEHHNHNHHTHIVPSKLNAAFVIGIILNLAFVIIEIITGLFTNSLALLSDAGHNMGDVAGLVLVLIAGKLSLKKPTKKYTYGYGKTTILVALANAGILLITVGAIGWEAIGRIAEPHIVEGKIISIVSLIGIIINASTALLFMKDREKDLNVKGAYLHMASDALVSFGVMVSGIIIIYTNWFWLDAIVSLAIILVIIGSTWGLLKDSIRLSLDGVPSSIDTESISHYLLNLKGVTGIHDLHIWAMSTNSNALTAHLVIPEGASDVLLTEIKNELHHHFNIDHTTIQIETSDNSACEQKC